jgi:hypothetical protein
MNATRLLGLVLVLAFFPAASRLQGDGDDGWVKLFNGKDLTGWVRVNCAPETFSVKDGMIFCTGKPTGVLRTDKQYENFILEMEWNHLKPKGNSGLFIWSDPLPAPGVPFTRAIEVQVLDGIETKDYTSDGDVFSIHGSTLKPDRPHPSGWQRCLPSERRSKPSGQWNHYRVECNNGVLKLAVNGKVVSGGVCNPRKGYICLESEGSDILFKNLRIKELPSTNPKPEEIARVARGFVPLYTGLDLRGWKQAPGHEGHWQPKDWILDYDGKSKAGDLWSEKEHGDFELSCDWRFTAKPQKRKRPVILPSGDYDKDDDGKMKEVEVLDAGDSGIYLRGNSKSQVNMWCWPIGSGEVYGYRTDPKMSAEVRKGVTPRMRADKPLGQWNRFHITMKGDRLTVDLNGKRVIDNAQLPGVPTKGPIALQHHGDPVQFANIFIRELKE